MIPRKCQLSVPMMLQGGCKCLRHPSNAPTVLCDLWKERWNQKSNGLVSVLVALSATADVSDGAGVSVKHARNGDARHASWFGNANTVFANKINAHNSFVPKGHNPSSAGPHQLASPDRAMPLSIFHRATDAFFSSLSTMLSASAAST